MASGTFPSSTLPPPPPIPAESLAHEQIIRRQLGRATLHVRLVDLASSLTVWAIGVLALFLLAALADHWIGLGISGRFLALALLLGGTAYYLVMHVVPLLVHTINPTYAARTIEEATPSLKNSLINFLLLRQDRASIKEIVFQAVERKAASDIASLPVEATVDRSRLIHAGYVLLGVMALFAAYKFLSPKDPFQTVARVLAPWADIARPSRVQITDVQPGNSEVYHGQRVKVSALVHGIRDGQPVTVRYSTADGQTVDRPVTMTPAVGGRYECTLPPAASSGESPLTDFSTGIQQNVLYRIVAGDAETTAYRLTATAAPTIIVDRLEYNFPPYTKLPPQTVLQQGDIKALEGTKVTIHAIANQPVKLAHIEFDSDGKDGTSETMPLVAEEMRARGTTILQLKSDRRSPWHASYQVRFYNERGQPSQQPIQHKIEVLRDLPPEVQILRPERLRIEVPEDGEQTIEVRAVDPDFALSSVRIEGVVGGKSPVKVDLVEQNADQPPQATLPYVFRPTEHKLVAGDELKYVAIAEDNRANPLTGSPDPNAARTAEYTLVVTPPRNKNGGQGQPGNAQPKNQEQGQPENRQPPKVPPAQPGPNDQPPRQPDQANQQPMNPGAAGKSDQQRQPEQGGKQQNQQPAKQQEGEQQKGQGQGGQEQKGQQGQQGGEQQGGQTGNSQGQSQQGQQQGASAEGANSGASSQPNSPMEGGAQGAQSGTERRQDKAHDGEAIEQVIRELQQKDGDAAGEPNAPKQPSGAPSEPTAGQKAGADGQTKSKSAGQNQKGQDQKSQGQQASTPMPGAEPAPQPQAAGKSGAKGQQAESSDKPGPSDQKLDPMGKGQPGQGEKGEPQDRLADEKQGQNAAQQKSGGNEGGVPKGPTKAGQDPKASESKGEKRDPGAAQQGEEGAGDASKEKGGSAEGTKTNRDRIKEQKADSSKPQEGEPSPPSESKKQSDSKGGQSGDRSGGGKQGSGQSAGQEGNDSAGSKSAADQGAGKAGETGSGETGSKAGSQKEGAGKTGQSGQQKGEGSGTKSDEQGSTPSAKGDPQQESSEKAKGEPSKAQPEEGESGGKRGGSGQPIEGGGDGERPPAESSPSPEVAAADAANLEYARKATELALKRLKDEEHNPDPELLDKLGWSKEDLTEFLRRWDALQKSSQETKDGKRELDEALRSLGLRDPANRKRAGGAASDTQRDLRDAGNRSSAPPKYRDLYDSFRKGAARSR